MQSTACQVCLTPRGGVSTLEFMQSRVRELRSEQGVSQQKLAEAVGVSRQTINSLEKGRYDPSLRLAVLLARYFHTTVEELFHVE